MQIATSGANDVAFILLGECCQIRSDLAQPNDVSQNPEWYRSSLEGRSRRGCNDRRVLHADVGALRTPSFLRLFGILEDDGIGLADLLSHAGYIASKDLLGTVLGLLLQGVVAVCRLESLLLRRIER